MSNTRWIVGTLVVALGALGMGGCYYDFGDSGDDATPSTPITYGASGANVTRWTGRADAFRGDLGNVQRFDGAQATVAGTEYGTTSSVRIDAENTGDRWWAMTQLSVSGSLRHPALVPGAHLVFNRSTRVGTGAQALSVSALGCSGPRMNQYTFDRGADAVTVDVSEGPTADTRRMTFDAKFAGPSGEQHVTGSFVYEPQ
jgi:hypothetical protein